MWSHKPVAGVRDQLDAVSATASTLRNANEPSSYSACDFA